MSRVGQVSKSSRKLKQAWFVETGECDSPFRDRGRDRGRDRDRDRGRDRDGDRIRTRTGTGPVLNVCGLGIQWTHLFGRLGEALL